MAEFAKGGKIQTKRSLVPAKLDNMPWSKFHWLVVVTLGITWILDGLEIQFASAISTTLQRPDTLHLSTQSVTLTASIYLLGEVIGALVFGRLADTLGRRRLFLVTLGLYLVFNGLSGFAFDFWSLIILKFIAGMGIGGEYAAINSAIDELIPARFRGRVDIAINGTYWAGAAMASAISLALLDHNLIPANWGWRIALFVGPIIGISIWQLRKHIPESPRWLISHGRVEEAEEIVAKIEADIRASGKDIPEVGDDKAVEVREYPPITYGEITRVMIRKYPTRSILGFSLMTTQSFLYNAIFFTQGIVLAKFFGVPDAALPYFFFPFAIGNLIGPLALGPFFDIIGRRKLISSTYIVSGTLLLLSGYLFWIGALNAVTQTILWCVIFFIASAGASSGYLTVSEIFPLELRGQAISYFFAISQFCGGVIAPWLFGLLIGEATSRTPLFWGYVFGAALMIVGGLVAAFLGVDAERKSLEDIATPLSVVQKPAAGTTPQTAPGAPA
ncbi:MFS transporter [Fodinicola acaciae]|uniref:MFS transporter n=1 Tax=Fodinicola acaciae TaxID=2681555 RepID=UPI0013D52C5D|nr:MFS transporter [Fodinicola acaciae]